MDYYNNNRWDTKNNNNNNGNFNYYGDHQDSDEVVSVGAWVAILIITSIPVIDIIALFIMALSHGNKNIKNFAKASLIIIAIPLTLLILLRACSRY